MSKNALIARGAISILAVATAQLGNAQQQTQPPAPNDSNVKDETIVVTGFRGTAQPLQKTKLDATQIVDVLTQKQIELIPDQSLAQVLDRVVGASSDRGFSSSQPRTVTLRGFDSRYNSMDVDGNLIWNSSRNNRGTQLDVFPASVISQVSVFKTVTPDMDANSIGGHIELRTLRAFDGGTAPYTKVDVAGGLYDQRGTPDTGRPTFKGNAVTKFTFGPERQFGVVLGGEYQQYEWYDHYNEVTGYTQVNGLDVVNGNINLGIFQQRQSREALYGKLETRSSDKYYGFLSASYFSDNLFQTFNRGGVFITGSTVTNVGNDTGTFTNATAQTSFQEYRLKRQTLLIGSGLDYRVAKNASIKLRAGYTRYMHDESLLQPQPFQLSGLSGTYDVNGTIPNVTYSPASAALIANASNYLFKSGSASTYTGFPDRDNVYNLSGELNWNGQDAARGLGFVGGGFWRRLDRNYDNTVNSYTVPKGTVLLLSNELSPSVGTQNISGINPVFIDRNGVINYYQTNGVFTQNLARTADYILQEDVLAGHAALTFRTNNFNILAGFRVERTNFTDTTANTVSGVIVPQVTNLTYTNFFPNVQLAYEPIAKLKLRAAFTETIARPDFQDFAMGTTQSVNSAGVQSISGSNPLLAPRTSNNYDLSAEYYFKGGYLALGLFQKDLSNETFRQVTNTFNAAGQLTLIQTVPLNTGSARSRGIEASAVIERLSFLPAFLANFGINANATIIDGQWNVTFTDGTKRTVGGLRNQPKFLGNLIGTYNQGPFSANVAWRLRGRTFTGSFGAVPAGDVWVASYSRVDAQVAYQLTSKLKVYGEAQNLTNTYWRETSGISAASTTTATSPGRTYWIGATLKM